MPNSKDGPHADTERFGEPAGWHADGDMQHVEADVRAKQWERDPKAAQQANSARSSAQAKA